MCFFLKKNARHITYMMPNNYTLCSQSFFHKKSKISTMKKLYLIPFALGFALVANAQNVGIGQATPISKIDVNGNVTVGATYSGVNGAPTNGARIEGHTVVGKATGEDSRDVMQAHVSSTAYSNLTSYPSSTGPRALAGYAGGVAGGVGALGYASSNGYGVLGITQAGALSTYFQGGEAVAGQADGAATGFPISIHGMLDETVAGNKAATPIVGENNNITPGNALGGAYGTSGNHSVCGVYGNYASRFAAGTSNRYAFGVIGDVLAVDGGTATPDGSGGVVGFNGFNDFGMLGYISLAGTPYCIYGGGDVSNIASGNTGKMTKATNLVGLGINGGAMGGYVQGANYGMLAAGRQFGMYVQGKTLTNAPIIQLNSTENGTRVPTYASMSTSLDVTAKGQSRVKGNTFIPFDAAFKATVDATKPIIITITPVGQSNGLYIAEVTENGFFVKENNNGSSSVNANWIAVGSSKAANVQISEEILSSSFDDNMRKAMSPDGGAEEAQPMYFDGTKMIFGERLPEGIRPQATKKAK
jgi:hypothetical protein